jgi:hypothetical protein
MAKMPMVEKGGKMVPEFAADGEGKMRNGGVAKAKMMAGGGMMKSKMMASGGMMKKGYASGGMMSKMAPSKMGKVATGKPATGSASKRADGIAMKGKTKGKLLAKGGMTK